MPTKKSERLYDVLIDICPPCVVAGNKSLGVLAEHLGLSRQAVSRWSRRNALPSLSVVRQLNEVAGGDQFDRLLKFLP